MGHNSLELMALYHKAKECYQKQEAEKYEEGFQFLLEAAENGMTEACKLLGLLYMSGQYAPWPEKEEEQAARWWRAAAENGDEEAMFWLGQCYEDGIGVEANAEEARIWKKFALENGFMVEGEETAEEAVMAPPQTMSKAEAKPDKKVDKKIEKLTERIAEKDAKLEARKAKAVMIHKEEEEAEAARFAREEAEARRINNQYRIRMGIGGAICCLLAVLIVILVVFWVVQSKIREYAVAFWILAGIIGVITALSGYAIGVKKAAIRVEEVAEYRKSPFYHAHVCELGQMTVQQKWCHKVYQSLAKNYLPVTYRKKLDLPSLREYRGCMYPHWIYQNGNEKAQPEFVVLTEKAVYVIRTEYFTGRIQGDLMDTKWALYSDGEKDLTVQYIPNLVDENARNVRIIKEDLQNYFDLPLEQIPFYNVIFVNEEVDIKGLRRVGAADNTVFVQGMPDKLRGSMGIWESRLYTHNLGMEDITFAFEQVGRQFIRRSGW